MLLTVEQIKELSEHVDQGLSFNAAEEIYGVHRGTMARYVNAYRRGDMNSVMDNIDRLLLVRDEIVDMTRKEIFKLFMDRFGVKLHHSTFTYAASRANVEYMKEEREVFTKEAKEKAARILKSGHFVSMSKLASEFGCSEFQMRHFAKSIGITRVVPTREKVVNLLKESCDYISTDEVALKLKITRTQACNAIQSIRTFNVAVIESIKIGRKVYYKIN